MKYLLSQEEMDEFNSDNNMSTIAALELRVKELEYGIKRLVDKADIDSYNSAQLFNALIVRINIKAEDIPECIAMAIRNKRR